MESRFNSCIARPPNPCMQSPPKIAAQKTLQAMCSWRKRDVNTLSTNPKCAHNMARSPPEKGSSRATLLQKLGRARDDLPTSVMPDHVSIIPLAVAMAPNNPGATGRAWPRSRQDGKARNELGLVASHKKRISQGPM